uniref:Uncharacterized protein n=1 Tax=Romanomermis culicivorax TaxID=13658 RepID=A0A915KI06_ROMCU
MSDRIDKISAVEAGQQFGDVTKSRAHSQILKCKNKTLEDFCVITQSPTRPQNNLKLKVTSKNSHLWAEQSAFGTNTPTLINHLYCLVCVLLNVLFMANSKSFFCISTGGKSSLCNNSSAKGLFSASCCNIHCNNLTRFFVDGHCRPKSSGIRISGSRSSDKIFTLSIPVPNGR